MRALILFILIFPSVLWATLPKIPAILIAKSPLLAERNLSSDIRKVVYEGELVEVLESYEEEGLDKDQNQTFAWYFVKIASGESGWIFGNNVAIKVDFEAYSDILPTTIDQQTLYLGDVFGETTQWFAAVQGHDAGVYEQGDYCEIYLVLTAASGQSLYYPCAQKSSEGKTILHHFKEMDLTNDQQPEIILDMEACEGQSSFGNRWVEVLSIQSGFFQKLFTEELSLYTPEGLPSPVRYKTIEFDPNSIRIEYVDFQPVETSAHQAVGFESATLNHTTFLTWNPYGRTFNALYAPLEQPLNGRVLQGSVPMFRSPNAAAPLLGRLFLNANIKVLRLFEEIGDTNGSKSMRPWYFVQNLQGETGYVEAIYIGLQGCAHGDVLNGYIKAAPLSYADWQVKGEAVFFIK